jgi:glutamate formiminotransferase
VAYNVWLDSTDLEAARAIAAAVRRPGLRALGLATAGATQVACNLVEPWRLGPADAYDAISSLAAEAGIGVLRAELVGLVPRAVVRAVPRRRWQTLDLDDERTLEARLSDGPRR